MLRRNGASGHLGGGTHLTGNFEIFRDTDLLYRFHLMDEHGGVLVTSAGYHHKREAVTAITAVRENAAMGHIRDRSEASPRMSRLVRAPART
ncbi:YegP family protein [Arthrobacter subterraneus]|uniref:YegP family protein n=1 Tax=Arthrobacter subterraneus TaxID=335973 RepID=UPI0038197131